LFYYEDTVNNVTYVATGVSVSKNDAIIVVNINERGLLFSAFSLNNREQVEFKILEYLF
jgi:hypothetical protein